MARVTIKGLDMLTKQLRSIGESSPEASRRATFAVAQTMADEAKQRFIAESRFTSGEGGTAGNLTAEVEMDGNNAIGRVNAASPIFIYREFGTGPNGEASVKDLPEGVNPVYTQVGWLIPQAESGDLSQYGYPTIEIKGSKFHPSNGQPAKPFLYPAFKEVAENAESIYADVFRANLGGSI